MGFTVHRSLVILATLIIGASVRHIYGCPQGWEGFEDRCYLFVRHPLQTYRDALDGCRSNVATLLSVNSASEHVFISNYLKTSAFGQFRWHTSGQANDNSVSKAFRWNGDGQDVDLTLVTWQPQEETKFTSQDVIVYSIIGGNVVWARERPTIALPYVCEIPNSEVYRIREINRDFAYGLDTEDPAVPKRGPSFLVLPVDIYITKVDQSSEEEERFPKRAKYVGGWTECVARGDPMPTYTWYKRDTSGNPVEVTIVSHGSSFSITNGRMTVDAEEPNVYSNIGQFYCTAENVFGKIVSNDITIHLAFVGVFSNTETQGVTANAYEMAALECQPPSHSPGLSYQWTKDNVLYFVNEEDEQHFFVSAVGILYFSQVTESDRGRYSCMVTLNTGQASDQTDHRRYLPSRISLPKRLVVQEQTSGWYPPEIEDLFPYVFPSTTFRGGDMHIECFASGTTPLFYSWTRDGRPMPSRARTQNWNRVLVIEDLELDDSGTYRCHVTRQGVAGVSKAVAVTVSAKPFFLFPLRDIHADKGATISWTCYARGVPDVTYTWLKDGELVRPVSGKISVNRNVLRIQNLDLSDDGMYQCGVSNDHGNNYNSAQLRILLFAPTFRKSIKDQHVYGSERGEITLTCDPEAAPYPDIRWSFRGTDVGVGPGEENDKMALDLEGTLTLKNLQHGDEGEYTCTATNDEGSDTLKYSLIITQGIQFMTSPSPASVYINDTHFLYCKASFNPYYDTIYTWNFNGRRINLDTDAHFKLGTGAQDGGLYIRNIQNKHEGNYACVVHTVQERAEASAHIEVIGPPGAPGGVHTDLVLSNPTAAHLKWMDGETHGSPTISYNIEARSTYNMIWQLVGKGIIKSDTFTEAYPDEAWRVYLVDGLKPGNDYQFRVSAENAIGMGIPSSASDYYHTPSARPAVAPRGVGGGGGAIGLLHITWEKLSSEDLNGENTHYVARWRRYGNDRVDFREADPVSGDEDETYIVVGKENYYMQYEVQVQAGNSLGRGPNSTIAVIYSAEEIPLAIPRLTDIEPINGTALEVTWEPVEDSREYVRGELLGYVVVYWLLEDNSAIDAATYYGQRTSAVVIGLDVDSWYEMSVQVFNSAGLGNPSETDEESTNGSPPTQYPTEVQVHSAGPTSVYVTFRGMSPTQDEDPYMGYKIRYWVRGDDIRSATDVDLDLSAVGGTITGLKKNFLYEMRMLGVSSGGDGLLSPSVLFTVDTQVYIGDTDHKVSEVKAAAGVISPYVWLICITKLLSIIS